MRPKLATWLIAIFIPAASGAGIGGIPGGPGITCNTGAASIPVFDPSSTSGAVGDYTLDCTGGTAGQIFQTDFTAFMNVSVIQTNNWILSVGGIDFPGTPGLSNVVDFNGVSIDPPGAGQLHIEVENILVNPSVLPPGAAFREDVAVTSGLTINTPIQEVAVNAAPEPSTLPLTFAAIVALGLACLCRRMSRSPFVS